MNVENVRSENCLKFLTYMVNMCKYFVTTVTIKFHHLSQSQLSVGTFGNKIGVLRTQIGQHIITVEHYYVYRETKTVTKSAINTHNRPTICSRPRYNVVHTMKAVTHKPVQYYFGLCAVRTPSCYIH